jgi:hypothetical protein
MQAVRTRLASLALLALLLGACRAPDPKEELTVTDYEGYWIVNSPVGDTQRIAPTVRFKVKTKGTKRSIEATATFRRKGEDAVWGEAWSPVSVGGKPLEAGEVHTLVLTSDRHYTSSGSPETMLTNAAFKDVVVSVFARIGGGTWTKLRDVDIERRLGSASSTAQAGDVPASPAPSPAH